LRHVLLFSLVGCYATVQIDPADAGPPIRFADDQAPDNLLIISVDTTRRDYIGRFSGNGLTPNLDAVLAESVVLEDHHSCSNWTAPSMTCVVTGQTQMEQGFGTWNSNPYVSAFPGPDFVNDTLATWMSSLGKQTLLITANSVFGPWSTGIAVGYDNAINADYQQAEGVVATAMVEIPALIVAGQPWYAHVHFMDPHGPYCAPDDFVNLSVLEPVGMSTADWCADSYGLGGGWYVMSPKVQEETLAAYLEVYEGEMKYWDTHFGDFWAQLEAVGALDNTLVMFVTDHGQQFFERGGHGHGIYLGPEENRSTAAFWAKTLEPLAWTEPTIHQDLNATLNDVYGITPIQPRSGYALGTAPDRSIDIINYWGGTVELGVIRDNMQLNYNFDGRKSFYKYDTDPNALVDVYSATDPDVIKLWTDMDAWVANVYRHWPGMAPTVDQGP
jgi:arylsulfatase A-like enzyme